MTNQKRNIKHLIALLIAGLLFIFSSSITFAESEPNDSFETADPINIGLSNAEIGATINPDDDLDYYKFTAEAGRTYVIETYNIQGTSSDATGLWLYDDTETLIANDQFGNNGTGNTNARIIQTFTTTGNYYILVKEATYINWTGTYSLRVLPKYDEPGAEWDLENDDEPNDVMEIANEIDVGLSNAQTHQLFNHSNFVTSDSDYDFYHFEAEAGQTYVIETYDIQGTGSDATGLWLYDSSGTPLANDQFGNNGTGNVNARIVQTFTVTGTYFIGVKDATYINWSGTYSIRILPQGAVGDPENDYEPNDVMAIANDIEVGLGNAQTHQLFNHSNYVTSDSDYDFYRFVAEAGHTYVIETFDIQGTGSDATGLWLYDSSGALITDDQFGNNGTGNANARIVQTFSTSGTYFIGVKDATYENWFGTYSIRILPKYDEPGAEWDATNDYEPNDVLPLAYFIGIGTENSQTHQLFDNSNYISRGADHDFYHFTAEANKTYVIETFGIQANGRATGLWLYNDAGTEVTNNQSGNTQNGTAEIEYTFATSGEYFILVKEALYTSWTGSYSIRVCEGSCAQNVYLPLITN